MRKRTSMKANRIIRATAAVVIAAAIGGCIYLNGLMPIITGYAAKNMASAVFISGRDPVEVKALDLDFFPVKLSAVKVDYEKKTATGRFLWYKSVAAFREGYGVTLLRGKGRKTFSADSFPLPQQPGYTDPLEMGDPEEIARLEPVTKALFENHTYRDTPFAFVVLHKGAIVAEHYREGLDRNTRLLSWSMGKSFTNALTGLMYGDGLVDINAPMDIPQWQEDGRKDITLKDLLQMQSGLEWREQYSNRSDVNFMLFREPDMGLYALSKPLAHEPGTHWYYSSGSTNIAMRYLRSKFGSDKEYYSYMRERLFAPLSIADPCFEPDMSGTPVGSSYLYVTARDYARFGQLYLDGGRIGDKQILPEGWVDFSVSPASGSDGKYGASFWLNKDRGWKDIPEDMFSCRGFNGQAIFIVPSQELVVVILGHSPENDHHRLMGDIIGSLAPEPAEKKLTSILQVLDTKTGEVRTVKEFPSRIEAPNWTMDGRYLIYNSGGRIWRIAPDGGQPEEIPTGEVTGCNNDHVLSSDGRNLAVSGGSARLRGSRIFILPLEGGEPRLVTPDSPSYLHGWSPDGRTLCYCAQRDGEFDVYTIPAEGGKETRLTSATGLDDGPEYSPDGRNIWFNSVRSGLMQIWRMNADGSDQCQMTFDKDLNSWFPHVSPDGKKVVFLSYRAGDLKPDEHLPDKHVCLRIMTHKGKRVRTLLKLFGGQGTINVNSWAPDSRHLAFVSYRLE